MSTETQAMSEEKAPVVSGVDMAEVAAILRTLVAEIKDNDVRGFHDEERNARINARIGDWATQIEEGTLRAEHLIALWAGYLLRKTVEVEDEIEEFHLSRSQGGSRVP